ncbi:MAG: hypothetical protein ACKO6N_12570 [Myxococcota bacterium]
MSPFILPARILLHLSPFLLRLLLLLRPHILPRRTQWLVAAPVPLLRLAASSRWLRHRMALPLGGACPFHAPSARVDSITPAA